jgi:hypothetical protein
MGYTRRDKLPVRSTVPPSGKFVMPSSGDISSFPGPDFVGNPSFAAALAIVVPGFGFGHCPDFRNDKAQATSIIIEGLVCWCRLTRIYPSLSGAPNMRGGERTFLRRFQT